MKKSYTKLLAIILSIFMLFGFSSVAFAADTLPDSITDGFTIMEPDNVQFALPKSSSRLSLQQLQSKFPHGKYWNHVGGNNNPYNWTNTPCTHHGSSCGYYPNNCTCNSFDNAIQCMGFSYKLAYDAYGTSARGWSQKSNLDGLKPGDIVRYATHSIFITAVNGNNITYGDANGINKSCVIRWNLSTTKSAILSKGLQYVKVAPWNLNQNTPQGNVTPSGIINGGIYYIKNHWQSKYLDVKDASVYNGAKLQVHPYNGSNAQKWKVTLNPNGTYRIVSLINQNYALNLTDGLDKQENRIQLWPTPYNDVNSQFRINNHSNGTSRISPVLSTTRSLDVYGASDTNRYGYAVQIWSNTSNPNQQWTFEPAEGTYYIKNVQYGKYLDVPNANVYNGAKLQVHTFNGSSAQKWKLSRNSDGTYKISSMVNTNYTIDIASAQDKNGKFVQLWENNTNINSKFNITMFNKHWQIRPAFSSTRGLDVATENSSTLQLWELNNINQNQHWVFEPV